MNNSLGEAIKKLRKDNGLTQRELARITGMSRSYIADVERGRYDPSLKTLRSIAKVFNVKTSHIFLLSEYGDTIH